MKRLFVLTVLMGCGLDDPNFHMCTYAGQTFTCPTAPACPAAPVCPPVQECPVPVPCDCTNVTGGTFEVPEPTKHDLMCLEKCACY